MNLKYKGVFIVGTDTEIGKTYISVSLVKCLKEQCVSVGVCKPFGSGSRSDALKLKKAARIKDDIEQINPLYFIYPMAPECSLKLEKREADINKAYGAINTMLKKYDFVVAEGIGGLMVPLNGRMLLVDFVKSTGLPVIVVSGSKLGTINHTLLTCEALRKRKIRIIGIIMNNYSGNLTARLSCESIQEHTSLPVLARIGRNKELKLKDIRVLMK